MINPFKKEIINVILYTNRVAIRRAGSPAVVERAAVKPFSSERMLVASVSELTDLVNGMLPELLPLQLLRPRRAVVLQMMEKNEGGIAETERMILNDLAMHIGGHYVFICETAEQLTDEALRQIVYGRCHRK